MYIVLNGSTKNDPLYISK